ncbi:MAG: hypothetical protein HEP71_28870 [Roseivirga sp.]|nr:hypothetical protein [Roseivirga sp.]
MQDRLEEFVKEHRNEFDVAEPKQELWDRITSDLDTEYEKVKPLSGGVWLWKAAVAVLLIAVTYLAVDKFVPVEAEIPTMASIEDFEEFEAFYTSIITEKSSKLSLELEGEEFFNYLEADIEELDAIYGELRATFEADQGGEQVLNRLVHLLRQKLHLINSQLDILEEAKNPVKTREDETNSI